MLRKWTELKWAFESISFEKDLHLTMDVLLNFRFGRISLCYTKGVWLFYFRAYTYNILGSIRKTGTVQWLEQFFFLCLGCKKKTVPNLKNGRNNRNYQKTAIFVKNLKCNIFQVFRRFFFFNPREEKLYNRSHEREEG